MPKTSKRGGIIDLRRVNKASWKRQNFHWIAKDAVIQARQREKKASQSDFSRAQNVVKTEHNGEDSTLVFPLDEYTVDSGFLSGNLFLHMTLITSITI